MDSHTRELLQALLDGETVQVLEAGRWEDAEDVDHVLFEVLHQTNGLRIKPRTITLAGIEIPEPLRVAPDDDAEVYVVNLMWNEIHKTKWKDCVGGKDFLRRGIVQATYEGAALQCDAIFKALGGTA